MERDEDGRPCRVVAGQHQVDFQMRVDRPIGSGETSPASDLTRLGGGKAANRAFLVRKLGVETWLLGRVGEDDLAEQALSPLRAAGVDLAGVSVAPEHATAISIIAVPPDGKKSIVLAGNANDTWDGEAIDRAVARVLVAPARSVLTVDYEIPAPVVRRIATAARTCGVHLIIDPSWPARVEDDVLAITLAIAPDAASHLTVTGWGSQPAYPTRPEIEALLPRLARTIRTMPC